MTKEEILAALKKAVGETSLSERTLSEYVDSVMPAEGTEPDADYFTRHASILKSLGGQLNHDVAAAIKTYKEQNPPTPPTSPKPTVPEAKENEEMQGLLQRMKDLEERNLANERRLLSEQMKNELLKKSSSLKVNNKPLWEDEVSRLDYSSFKSADEALEAVKASYEEKLARYTSGAAPYGQNKPDGLSPDEATLKKRQAEYMASLSD